MSHIPARVLALAAASLFAVAAPGLAQDVAIENNVPMQARDGVTLRSDIYRPSAPGRYPVILERTPYDKRADVNFGVTGASRGYVVVIQDVRGRWASDGEWYPLKNEANDGYDCVEWAAALPSSNGRVGMFGGSYVGATQMLAAIAAPPHLVCIMPAVIASDSYSHWVYQGGAFAQMLNQGWTSALALNTLERRVARTAQPSHWDMQRPLDAYPVLDLGSADSLAGYYHDWLRHPSYDDYWRAWSIEEHFSRITVPALHVGGWYDLFQDGTLRNYAGIAAAGGSEAARRGQRLVMAAGGHAGAGPKIRDVDFGKASVLDTWALAFRWYDYMLRGIDNGMAGEKPVRIFVMGKNVWRDEDAWPPARASVTPWYLHSGGGANSLAGDGRLGPLSPGKEPADTFRYDPLDPAPTLGGPAFGDFHQVPGPCDQRPVEARRDVLVYSTPPFASDTEITGHVTLDLYVSSSALDTDITGKLIDVAPDGAAMNLSEGILRLRYRESRERAVLMKPGEVYRVSIDLWSTSNVFRAGHALRLEISSSNFPRFDRNLNTGGAIGGPPSDARVAENSVYHDAAHPSALLVPLMP